MIGRLLRRLFAPLPEGDVPRPGSAASVKGPGTSDTLPDVSEDYQPHIVDIKAGTVTVFSAAGSVYEKSLSSPWWAAASRLSRGAFARYGSVGGEWHVFRIIEGPLYGRRDHQNLGLSVIAQRVSSGMIFTMPADSLEACDVAFAVRDGTKIKRGESDHWTANRSRRAH